MIWLKYIIYRPYDDQIWLKCITYRHSMIIPIEAYTVLEYMVMMMEIVYRLCTSTCLRFWNFTLCITTLMFLTFRFRALWMHKLLWWKTLRPVQYRRIAPPPLIQATLLDFQPNYAIYLLLQHKQLYPMDTLNMFSIYPYNKLVQHFRVFCREIFQKIYFWGYKTFEQLRLSKPSGCIHFNEREKVIYIINETITVKTNRTSAVL